LGISVSLAERMVNQPIQNSVVLFHSHRQKHQVSSPVIILLKKHLSVSAIAIMSWQNVTRPSHCSGLEECGTKCAHNCPFPKSSSLGDVQRFYYHSLCDSTVMFY
jgi:hypothetical protein